MKAPKLVIRAALPVTVLRNGPFAEYNSARAAAVNSTTTSRRERDEADFL